MRLVVSPAPRGKLRVEKQQPDGTIVGLFASTLADHKAFKEGAKVLGVKFNVLLDFIENGYRRRAETTLDLTTRPDTTFTVRSELGLKEVAPTAPTLADALKLATPGDLIEWESVEHVCCLDVDFHGKTAPEDLETYSHALSPAPALHWLSKSGGLHAVFYSSPLHRADELAACAAYQLHIRYPLAAFEFLSRTRTPAGMLHTGSNTRDIGDAAGLLAGIVSVPHTEWLADKGLDGAERFPHTSCPVAPSPRALANSMPVCVRPNGIFCYICSADGLCRGSKRAGWFPFHVLTGDKSDSAIRVCVDNLTHWGHAKHTFGQLPDSISKLLYAALLRHKHGTDPRIDTVFRVAEGNGLVRYDGYWCDDSGVMLSLGASSAILRSLPHCQFVDGAGELATDAASVEWLSQSVDQTGRGYAPVQPLRGLQFTTHQDTGHRLYTILHPRNLAGDAAAWRRPEYLIEDRRMGIGAAWDIVERAYPRADRALVELLLCGRGCIEERAGLPPMLFLHGPTGVGKTAHVKLAAAIAGDYCAEVPFKKDQERFRQAIIDAKQSGSFMLFDEIFKNARINKMGEMEAMESLLSITPDSMQWVMYVGSIRMGDLPFMVWADTHIPLAVMQHEQIGRRMFSYRLGQPLKWEESLQAAGILRPEDLRAKGSAEMVAAANAILSHVIDTHFQPPSTDFAQCATALGFKRLRDGEEVQDKYNLVRDLYRTLKEAPDCTQTEQDAHGRGCKVADPGTNNALFVALDSCWADWERGQATCAMVDECDVMGVLGFAYPAQLRIKKHGKRFYIRFHHGKLVNAELELPTS